MVEEIQPKEDYLRRCKARNCHNTWGKRSLSGQKESILMPFTFVTVVVDCIASLERFCFFLLKKLSLYFFLAVDFSGSS